MMNKTRTTKHSNVLYMARQDGLFGSAGCKKIDLDPFLLFWKHTIRTSNFQPGIGYSLLLVHILNYDYTVFVDIYNYHVVATLCMINDVIMNEYHQVLTIPSQP